MLNNLKLLNTNFNHKGGNDSIYFSSTFIFLVIFIIGLYYYLKKNNDNKINACHDICSNYNSDSHYLSKCYWDKKDNKCIIHTDKKKCHNIKNENDCNNSSHLNINCLWNAETNTCNDNIKWKTKKGACINGCITKLDKHGNCQNVEIYNSFKESKIDCMNNNNCDGIVQYNDKYNNTNYELRKFCDEGNPYCMEENMCQDEGEYIDESKNNAKNRNYISYFKP